MFPEEKLFEDELEVYRRQVDQTIQFFYGSLALNGYASRRRQVLAAIESRPAQSWAHYSQTWIALGRIFDQRSPHNVDPLLGFAQQHRSKIFSKEALGRRKSALSANAQEWLPAYLSAAYVPTAADFRRLRKLVAKYRRIYEARYKPIRDKVHAHTELVGQQASALHSKTTIREVERLLTFLKRLYEAIWQSLHNGKRPALRSVPYSASRMVKEHDEATDPWRQQHVQQIIVAETIRAMNAVTAGIEQGPQSKVSRQTKRSRISKQQ